ncbi:MAG: hypothetical protein M5U18_03050 [Dehalococcoidia bacterium]|nr:hypothetical protein [Dehalococcoidia bacterium]
MSVSKLRAFEQSRQVRYQTQRSSGSRPYFSLALLARALDGPGEFAPGRGNQPCIRDAARPFDILRPVRDVLDLKQNRAAELPGTDQQHGVFGHRCASLRGLLSQLPTRRVEANRDAKHRGGAGLHEGDVRPVVFDGVPVLGVEPRAVAVGWRGRGLAGDVFLTNGHALFVEGYTARFGHTQRIPNAPPDGDSGLRSLDHGCGERRQRELA